MSDSTARAGAQAHGLIYPFPEAPEAGKSLEIAPGVLWIRMPMPFALDHVNLWAIADGDGWTVVDTGLRSTHSVDVWEALFADALGGRPVTRVIATHMHPDHLGLAGWMTRRFDCRFWCTRLEYLNCRVLMADTGREAPPEAIAFLRGAGWTDAALGGYRARFGNFGQRIHPLPDSYRRIRDGETFRIGEHEWEVVVGIGHSPEHACLWSRTLKLFISGDQVLPRISSNVSVHPMEPDANPMADWLDSLQMLRARVDNDVLVMPGHNLCFHGLHERLSALYDGQTTTLDRLRERLTSGPQRVVDVFSVLFKRAITESDVATLGLATGEAQACLNYLRETGEATLHTDEAGIRWYTRA